MPLKLRKQNCSNCGYDNHFPMWHCPNCGNSLAWTADMIGSDCYDVDTNWAISTKFCYNPWTGQEYDGHDGKPVTRAKGFSLTVKCSFCEGFIEPFMSYCPSCGAGSHERRHRSSIHNYMTFGISKDDIPAELVWSLNIIGNFYTKHGIKLDDDCESCGWAIDSHWRFCAWCRMDLSHNFPRKIEELLNKIHDKLSSNELYEDEYDKLKRRINVGCVDDDYDSAVVRLRCITEFIISQKLGVKRFGHETLNQLIDQCSRSGSFSKVAHNYAKTLAVIGNKGAHHNGGVTEDELIDALNSFYLFISNFM